MPSLSAGMKAPLVDIPRDGGSSINTSKLDNSYVIYFYPKDDTPGCTKEACNLRDNYSDLVKDNFEVVGVSADDSKKHIKFINKYNLPFSLIADTDKTLIEAYGCWGLKKFMGREYEGIHRKTFVIQNQKILKIFEKVKTTDHYQQILDALN